MKSPIGAYLFRTASNLWLNEQRRNGRVKHLDVPESLEAPDEKPALAGDLREALLIMVEALSPQERIALVLKEVFDLPLSEIATHLQTSTGAVKHALHRAREKLAAARDVKVPSAPPLPPRPAVLDAFVEAFNAHSIDRIVALLRADATADVIGFVRENSREDIQRGSLPHTVSESIFARVVAYRGEWVVLLGERKAGSEEFSGVRDVLRFVTDGDQIVEMTYYFFTLDLLKEVLAELNQPADLCGVYYF